MAVNANISDHTKAKPASLNKMAVDKLTKWVVGDSCISHCSHTGILSSGVVPPDNNNIGISTGMVNKPNCGIERAKVVKNTASEVLANKYKLVTDKYNSIEPAKGMPKAFFTTSSNDSQVQTTTTNKLVHTLASIISSAVNGSTSKCSKVPCSRSRNSAVPVNKTAKIVTLLMI